MGIEVEKEKQLWKQKQIKGGICSGVNANPKTRLVHNDLLIKNIFPQLSEIFAYVRLLSDSQ